MQIRIGPVGDSAAHGHLDEHPVGPRAEPVNKFETHRRPSLARNGDHPLDHRRVDPSGIRRHADDRFAVDETVRILAVSA
jgi:hypothetical protein